MGELFTVAGLVAIAVLAIVAMIVIANRRHASRLKRESMSRQHDDLRNRGA